ncbi:MAG: hypothetical protein R2911_43115 [Caldilineaceae bacterium]
MRDFAGRVVESGCTAAAFQAALAKAAGGIVQIPACTFDIGRALEFPATSSIQGAGISKRF